TVGAFLEHVGYGGRYIEGLVGIEDDTAGDPSAGACIPVAVRRACSGVEADGESVGGLRIAVQHRDVGQRDCVGIAAVSGDAQILAGFAGMLDGLLSVFGWLCLGGEAGAACSVVEGLDSGVELCCRVDRRAVGGGAADLEGHGREAGRVITIGNEVVGDL